MRSPQGVVLRAELSVEKLYVFSQQKPGEASTSQSGILYNTLRVAWSWEYWKIGRVDHIQSSLTLDRKYLSVS